MKICLFHFYKMLNISRKMGNTNKNKLFSNENAVTGTVLIINFVIFLSFEFASLRFVRFFDLFTSTILLLFICYSNFGYTGTVLIIS